MKSRILRTSFILSVGIAMVILLWLLPGSKKELSYNDRPIEFWISNLRVSEGGAGYYSIAPVNSKPRLAIRYFGTNAVPYLLKNYDLKDSYQAKIVRSLATKFDLSLPRRLNRLAEFPGTRFMQAFEGFSCLGTQATSAIPTLAHHLFTSSQANWTAMALGFIGPDSIPTLFRGLSHPDPMVRGGTATGIQLLSPAGDLIVAELLKELGLPWNSKNSWENRSLFYLTGNGRAYDCWEIPAYPELEAAIKNKPLNQVSNAVNKVLADFDPGKIIASQAYRSTEAFLKLVEGAEPFINGTASGEQMTSFLNSLDHARNIYPNRTYSIEMLRLEILIEHRRYDDAKLVIAFLRENAGDSPVRWRDLASVLLRRGRVPTLPGEGAIDASEKAISLTDKPHPNLIRLAVDAYGHGSASPRRAELNKLLQGKVWLNPFHIPSMKPTSK